MEKTRTPSQIFTSSASSFFSAQSSTSSHYTLNNEQILQSFLEFLVRATPQIPEDVQQIKRWVKLITLIEETLNNDSIDVHIFGILDNMLSFLHKMSESLKSNQNSLLLEDRDRNKQDTAIENQTWSTVEKQTLPEIIITIQKIIFELFTGQNKDVYANAILSMDENIQKIFMIIIDYEMKKSSDLQHVEEDFSDEIKNQFTNNEFFVLNSVSLFNNNKLLSQAQKSELKLRKSIQNSNLPVVELVDKVLILEQTNQNLSQALEKAQNMSKTLSKDQSQLDSANKLLSQDNRNLNIRICLLLNQIQNLQAEKYDQISNLQKKWQGRMQIVEKNKKQHISELIEINQATQRKYEAKMAEYQERLQDKREKIKKLEENEQKLQMALKQEQVKSNTFKQEVENLNEIVRKNREELNELQLLKDSLTMEIDIRNNRIEDLRLLLISETNKIPKSTKYLDVACSRECCLNVPDLQQESQCGKQWRRESRRSRFQTLAFNRPHYVSQSDTGYSWFKNSFTTKNKKKCLEELASLSQSDLNKHYETHFNFLTKKIEGLQKQNQKFRIQLKKARDYKLQNSKLTKSLLQHQSYRGEENQILMGCLYELRAMTNGKQFSEIQLSQQRIAERIRVIKQNHLQSKSTRNMRFVSMQSLEEGFSDEEDDHDYGGFMPKHKFNQSENINFFSQVDTDKHSAQSQVQSNGTFR